MRTREDGAAISDDDPKLAWAHRRKSPRTTTLKGAQIVRLTGGPVNCIVRNLSEGGACLEVHGPVLQNTFELVFDRDQSRHPCRVVWRQPPRMGVQFQSRRRTEAAARFAAPTRLKC
jgi:hypothetical protein